MLSEPRLQELLARFPGLTVAVLGDLFLDRYLDLDARLTEPSLETGLEAYQVVRVRSTPGAAGTVLNNLAALGVGRCVPLAVLGDDGEGYELLQALALLPSVDREWLIRDGRRRTPTYTKPMLHEPGQSPRELNRLDVKNRTPLPPDLEQRLARGLEELWPRLDALLVVDQVSEPDCGMVTARMRDLLQQLGTSAPQRFILADSRERVGLFRSVCVKPNHGECLRAIYGDEAHDQDVEAAAGALARRAGRTVFCTSGAAGILVVQPGAAGAEVCRVPAMPVTGPIDIVGAGDSASAAIAAAVAAGAGPVEAAAFGNLVASITIQQLGTTGTATPDQVLARWRERSS